MLHEVLRAVKRYACTSLLRCVAESNTYSHWIQLALHLGSPFDQEEGNDTVV